MPAPGEQHLASGGRTAITNPFEEVRPRISEYTAQEIITLQTRLDKQLGPEYISSRAGPGGQKIHYLAGEKCIQLANEVLGFNGWSSQIRDLQVDYVDENPQTGKVSLGLSVVVRVTLRDGTYHEDLGYGHIENAKGKAAAFEKSKKEATTDGLKRALRMFGNVLGNCIKDKDYLQKVLKVKVPAPKWDVDNLHRHSTFAAPVKQEAVATKAIDEKPHNASNGSSTSNNTPTDTFDDEFGDFDEADFNVADPDSHPDEVVLPAPAAASHHFPGQNNNPNINTKPQNQTRPPQIRSQSMAAPPGRPQAGNAPNTNPQTPNAGFSRSTSGAGAQSFRPPQENGPQSRPIPPGPPHPVVKRVLNQPSRSNGVGSAPVSPARPPTDDPDSVGLPPQGAGFFSARGVAGVIGKNGNGDNADPNAPPPPIPANIAAFNPNLESPSIRRSEGVDHKSSKPLGRDGKHIPSPSPAVGARNIINPKLDTTRRIGAPGSPSPMANRNMYKPPSKRPVDSRAPLVDLPANGHLGGGDVGGDAKRQRMNG
ncbi:hypothetical protein HYFRA_00004802 [Hymenoscyphus fraxineus]|uniref:RAD52 homolog n=1 Tax=Hymenoscyphus fraxineus TaxID=746836 RepID=A0A9N9KKY7_9HELO|nr:hypothetical protein HYFRA_00004802 [Hymenoscyphus fraxineus]